MGKQTTTGPDLAAVSKTVPITDTTPSAWVDNLIGVWTLAVSGAFTGTLLLEVSFDGGATAIPVTAADGSAVTIAGPGILQIRTEEEGLRHRVRASAFTAGGTANCRLSGGRQR